MIFLLKIILISYSNIKFAPVISVVHWKRTRAHQDMTVAIVARQYRA